MESIRRINSWPLHVLLIHLSFESHVQESCFASRLRSLMTLSALALCWAWVFPKLSQLWFGFCSWSGCLAFYSSVLGEKLKKKKEEEEDLPGIYFHLTFCKLPLASSNPAEKILPETPCLGWWPEDTAKDFGRFLLWIGCATALSLYPRQPHPTHILRHCSRSDVSPVQAAKPSCLHDLVAGLEMANMNLWKTSGALGTFLFSSWMKAERLALSRD